MSPFSFPQKQGLSKNMIRKPHYNLRAFTLTEIAIVLGIIGLILGAIWTAAATVYENNKMNKAQTQIIAIAGAMKQYVNAIPTNGSAQAGLCKFGVFPPDMLSSPGNCDAGIVDPWGHAVTMQAVDSSTYQLQYATMEQSHCIGLLVHNGAQAVADAGLIGVSAGTQASGQGAANTLAIPVTPAAATSACPATANLNSDTAVFTFSVK